METGDAKGAGTDGSVSITLEGEKGSVSWDLSNDPTNNFERGATDVFYVTGQDVGVIKTATIQLVSDPKAVALSLLFRT